MTRSRQVRRAKYAPLAMPPTTPSTIDVRRSDGKIWSHLRQRWLVETPEERVRQGYLPVLVDEYGFSLDQMAEEVEVTGRGSGQARADFVVWRSSQDKAEQKSPLIVVECKADNLVISPDDYGQGENYARLVNAPFFVTHNASETKYWRVNTERMPKTFQEIENIPDAQATDRQIKELTERLKTFRGDEFAALLHQCHNVIRNREKKDPAAAFDEIAKVLFVKVWVERQMRQRRTRHNLFTSAFLEDQLGDNPLDTLFQQTKQAWSADHLFAPDERITLRPSTGKAIVGLLEQYNLSDTSEDIKGIAFEKFLGRTFRGEIGQFFTPRSIVEFMVRMMRPREGEVVCDPASGSGGFLILVFELIREQIIRSVDAEYEEYRKKVSRKRIAEAEKARLLRERWDELQLELAPEIEGSRIWKLANECIFGTDANERMARTSKMNMIMHGDGHGGVHYHDGFIDVDGIFSGRFDLVLTNPPFGSNVEPTDLVTSADIETSPELERRYEMLFGDAYREARARVSAAVGRPLLSLFELPRGTQRKVRTEVLFLERCLDLLRPGGRLAIVLPEGILNTPTQAYVRAFCEDRAFLRAVVSLPQDTFKSAGADVKPSLVFLEKFTDETAEDYRDCQQEALVKAESRLKPELETRLAPLRQRLEKATKDSDRQGVRSIEGQMRKIRDQWAGEVALLAREISRELFDYPVFLYEADKVGITATGEPDENELFPNDHQPAGVDQTCLELYEAFLTQLEAAGDER